MAQRLLGWWFFDPERMEMSHETTGQTLRCLGRINRDQLDITDSPNRAWLLFQYEDRETQFPVVVEWRNVPSKTAGRPLVWRIDYIRSAVMWRRKTNTAQPHPDYGLWRRLDDCLTDALPCWPSNPKTGAHPAYIGLNGGWLNGAWTHSLYRCVWGSTHLNHTTDAFQKAYLIPLAEKSPAAWQINSPASEADLKTWNILPDDIRDQLHSLMKKQPYLTTEDHGRLLIAWPGGKTRFNLKRFSSFFYADRNLITDALQAGIRDVSQHQIPNWTVVIAKDSPFGFINREHGEKIPLVPFETKFPNGQANHLESAPLSIERKLAHASIDAWLSQPDTQWMSCGPMENADPLSAPPATVFISDWELAGSISPSRLEASATLKDLPDGRPHPLAHLFDEENDGITRATSSFVTKGYWRFDPASQSLSNTLSNQRLIFESGEMEKIENGQTEKIWRFRYENADITYPVVVRSRARAMNGRITYTWLIDHERSKTIWMQKASGHSIPPFGLWQRVNECAMDALLCWPEIEATGPKPYGIVAVGGWFNGAWSPSIHRRREHGLEHSLVKDGAPIPPFIEDLNATPHKWQFIDAPRAVRGAKLADVEELSQGRLYLPAEKPLTGFEADIPHMRRDDGKAVLFPANVKSDLHRGEDYAPQAVILYADEDLFFCFQATEFIGFGNLPSGWTYKLGHFSGSGLRQLDQFDDAQPNGIPAHFFSQFLSPYNWGKPFAAPSPALTQRLDTALADAGLAWAGSSLRLLDDPEWLGRMGERVPPLEKSGINLGKKSQVRIEGGYVGGRYNATAPLTAWINETPFKDI